MLWECSECGGHVDDARAPFRRPAPRVVRWSGNRQRSSDRRRFLDGWRLEQSKQVDVTWEICVRAEHQR